MMHFQDFQQLAIRTAKPLSKIENLRHVAYGVTGEAGEFVDALKKHDIYGQALDHANLVEELGDLLWYVALGAETLGVPMDEIASNVIMKLQVRYPEKYEDALAAERLDKA